MVELMLVGLTLKPTSGAAVDVADADRKMTVKQTRRMRGFEVVYAVDSFFTAEPAGVCENLLDIDSF